MPQEDATLPDSAPVASDEKQESTSVINTESAESAPATPAGSVTVVLSRPNTVQELIAARALKRAARKTAVREQAEGYKRAGDMLIEAKKFKAAYFHYLEATQLRPSNPVYLISLAGAYRKLHWYEEAAYAATQALTLDPKNSEARYVRGVARMEQRLLRPARMDFETVLKHHPGHLLARAALTEVTRFIEVSGHPGSLAHAANPIEVLIEDVDFGFPHYDQEALEITSVSDSSDCNHVGNGIQCRFYNHQGCARGSACMFSHAPDEKSVRDDLGRNVCTYFLLGSCKFGETKCIYSHSKEALSKKGWWSSPEQIEKAKTMMAVADQNNREKRHFENERRKARLRAKAAAQPPKSAGVKDGQQNAGNMNLTQESPAATEPTANGTGVPAAGAKPPVQQTKADSPKQQPQPRKKPAATTSTSAAPAPVPTEKTNSAAASLGFTDYKQDEHPTNINPDSSIVLQY